MEAYGNKDNDPGCHRCSLVCFLCIHFNNFRFKKNNNSLHFRVQMILVFQISRNALSPE
jgi:hypothetical protein